VADAYAKLACPCKFALGRLDGQNAGCDVVCVAVTSTGFLDGKLALFLSVVDSTGTLAAQWT
jgi:hypothetical protein